MEFQRKIRVAGRAYVIVSDDDYLRRMGTDFEPDSITLLGAFVDKSTIAADVGANIGLTTLFLGQRASKVVGFEPSPSTYGFLKRNIECAKLGNCTVENIGLGSRRSESEISFAQTDRSGGFISDSMKPSAGHVTERISVEALDAVWDRYADGLNFIKIDVEGYEQEVIEGGRAVIARCKPTIVLELNHWCLNAFRRRSVPDFFDFLREVFPYIYAVDRDNQSLRDLHQNDHAYDVLHEHIVKFRYPNIVAGFSAEIPERLASLPH